MTPQEWSGPDLVAALAAIGVILTAWRQYRIEQRQATERAKIAAARTALG